MKMTMVNSGLKGLIGDSTVLLNGVTGGGMVLRLIAQLALESPDTGFDIQTLQVWGRARYLSVTEVPHNTEFYEWMEKKQLCFFQTAETGNEPKNKKNKLFSTILSWFDLAVTLRWSNHDLGITPLWNLTLTHVTMCTCLGFRPIYSYTILRVKGTILRWPLMTLPMRRKSADHLKRGT